MAPVTVNISRYMAILILASSSFTKAEADPDDVAMMATMLEAMASLTGTPSRTRMGTSMLAPPRPVSEPRKPTATDRAVSDRILSAIKHLPERFEVDANAPLLSYSQCPAHFNYGYLPAPVKVEL